jgi:hypothetical protein
MPWEPLRSLRRRPRGPERGGPRGEGTDHHAVRVRGQAVLELDVEQVLRVEIAITPDAIAEATDLWPTHEEFGPAP